MVLDISEDATEKEIKKAWRSKSQQHHPDKDGDVERFHEVQNAYEMLSNPLTREDYDQLLKAARLQFKEVEKEILRQKQRRKREDKEKQERRKREEKRQKEEEERKRQQEKKAFEEVWNKAERERKDKEENFDDWNEEFQKGCEYPYEEEGKREEKSSVEEVWNISEEQIKYRAPNVFEILFVLVVLCSGLLTMLKIGGYGIILYGGGCGICLWYRNKYLKLSEEELEKRREEEKRRKEKRDEERRKREENHKMSLSNYLFSLSNYLFSVFESMGTFNAIIVLVLGGWFLISILDDWKARARRETERHHSSVLLQEFSEVRNSLDIDKSASEISKECVPSEVTYEGWFHLGGERFAEAKHLFFVATKNRYNDVHAVAGLAYVFNRFNDGEPDGTYSNAVIQYSCRVVELKKKFGCYSGDIKYYLKYVETLGKSCDQ